MKLFKENIKNKFIEVCILPTYMKETQKDWITYHMTLNITLQILSDETEVSIWKVMKEGTVKQR